MYSIDSFHVTEVRDVLPVEYVDWSVTYIGIDALPFDGAGELVGVLDTDCDESHPDLAGQVEFHDFISGALPLPDMFKSSHGTFVTGQIVAANNGLGVVGAAPGAKVYHGRVLYGSMADFARDDVDGDIARALRACVDAGCGVISMSLGGPDRSKPVADALQYAVDNGVIPIAAAGNERLIGSPYASYPASDRNVISVASANKKGLPAWFSTVGHSSKPDIASSPEVAIASLEYYWGCLYGGKYGRMIGTSMAAPTLAAVAALWCQAYTAHHGSLPRDRFTLDRFRRWLHRVAKDVNVNGWDPELGFGTLLLNDSDVSSFGG
jgi:subtilisin family serine protease